MRILMVTTDFIPNVSGIATLSFEQAAGLQARGHTVRVFTTTAGAATNATRANLDVKEVSNTLPPIIRLGNLLKILHQAVAEWKPDFIWCTNYRGFGLPVMISAQMHGIPYGLYYHGTELITEDKSFVRRRIFKSVAKLAMIRCTNSMNTAGILKKRYGFDAIPVTPGVHPAPDKTPESSTKASALRKSWLSSSPAKCPIEDRVVFLALCRISRQKGIHIVLEALALLVQPLRERALFIAVGSGEAIPEFEELADRLGIRDHVLLPGSVSREQIRTVLNAADVYLQPSQPEGDFLESFGISFLEAQAAGLPCIGTNWGGVPEAVQAPVTGMLVPTESAEAVAQAMATAIRDKDWLSTAKVSGPAWAEQNSWEIHMKTIESLLPD